MTGQHPLQARVGGVHLHVAPGPGGAEDPAGGDQVVAAQEPRHQGGQHRLVVAAALVPVGPAQVGVAGQLGDGAGGVDAPVAGDGDRAGGLQQPAWPAGRGRSRRRAGAGPAPGRPAAWPCRWWGSGPRRPGVAQGLGQLGAGGAQGRPRPGRGRPPGRPGGRPRPAAARPGWSSDDQVAAGTRRRRGRRAGPRGSRPAGPARPRAASSRPRAQRRVSSTPGSRGPPRTSELGPGRLQLRHQALGLGGGVVEGVKVDVVAAQQRRRPDPQVGARPATARSPALVSPAAAASSRRVSAIPPASTGSRAATRTSRRSGTAAATARLRWAACTAASASSGRPRQRRLGPGQLVPHPAAPDQQVLPRLDQPEPQPPPTHDQRHHHPEQHPGRDPPRPPPRPGAAAGPSSWVAAVGQSGRGSPRPGSRRRSPGSRSGEGGWRGRRRGWWGGCPGRGGSDCSRGWGFGCSRDRGDRPGVAVWRGGGVDGAACGAGWGCGQPREHLPAVGYPPEWGPAAAGWVGFAARPRPPGQGSCSLLPALALGPAAAGPVGPSDACRDLGGWERLLQELDQVGQAEGAADDHLGGVRGERRAAARPA